MNANVHDGNEPHGASPDKNPTPLSKRAPESREGDTPKEQSPDAPSEAEKSI